MEFWDFCRGNQKQRRFEKATAAAASSTVWVFRPVFLTVLWQWCRRVIHSLTLAAWRRSDRIWTQVSPHCLTLTQKGWEIHTFFLAAFLQRRLHRWHFINLEIHLKDWWENTQDSSGRWMYVNYWQRWSLRGFKCQTQSLVQLCKKKKIENRKPLILVFFKWSLHK